MNPQPGQVLQERYRIVKKLGEGGMGSVYEGEHLLIQRRVAIKILHAQLSDRAEVVERFHREARAAAAIGHPNIIEVTDFGTLPDGSPYMVLEFLDGRDFAHDLRQQGPQPIGKVAHVLVQVCRALAAAEEKGIVHRDVKPENIFLLERNGDPNFVKVLDFGISKFRDAGDSDAGSSHRLTKTGAALGTPYYMSPEACQGRLDLDHRADIYALGVILFQALTGEYPFDDSTYPMLVLRICTQPPPEMTRWRADLPAELIALVRAMLAKRPSDRPSSFQEVASALLPFVDDRGEVARVNTPRPASVEVIDVELASQLFGTETGETGPLRAPSRPRTVRRFVVLATLLLAIAGICGGGLGFSLPIPDPPAVTVLPAEPPPAVVPPDAATPDASPVAIATIAVEPATPLARPVPSGPRRSHIHIEVTPENAEMFLDGERISNPYDDDLEISEIPRALVATAPGYRRLERPLFVPTEHPIRLELTREHVVHHAEVRDPIRPPSTVIPPPPPPPPLGSGRRRQQEPVDGRRFFERNPSVTRVPRKLR